MAHDVTLTVYKAREKSDNKGVSSGYHKPDKAKCEEAVRKWKLRRAKKKFDFKKFLGGGDKPKEEEGKKD
jgi:hypothetical protein